MNSFETTVKEAESSARRMADKAMLPQTIFRNTETNGWWHTNPLARIFHKTGRISLNPLIKLGLRQ